MPNLFNKAQPERSRSQSHVIKKHSSGAGAGAISFLQEFRSHARNACGRHRSNTKKTKFRQKSLLAFCTRVTLYCVLQVYMQQKYMMLGHENLIYFGKLSNLYCCDRKSRAECAQSFAPWQQAIIEITRRDHSRRHL